MIGARLSYTLRSLTGVYTVNRWDPDVDINAHMFSAYLTLGTLIKVSNKFKVFFQVNGGPTSVQWYESGQYKDSFVAYYLPIDIGAEYEIRDKVSLTFGFNVKAPLYKSTAEVMYVGIRKEF